MSDGGSTRRETSAGAQALRRETEGLELTETVFKLFQGVILKSAGIYLAEHKRALLVRRLRGRIRALGLRSYLDYYRLVTRLDDSSELVTMLDLVTTNETRFFREPTQLEMLQQELIPSFEEAAAARRRPRRLRAWCAACSSGEEPFTLAALLARQLSSEWRREVLATDLSTRMLERGRRATWPSRQLAQIPVRFRSDFVVHRPPRGSDDDGTIEARPHLRAMVRFERQNLFLDSPPAGPFDLVLCRNVLMYFDQAAKRQVVAGLLSVLDRNGYLLVGHADSLSGLHPGLRLVAPTIYAHDNTAGNTDEQSHPGTAERRMELEP